jgi:hypothetical protein
MAGLLRRREFNVALLAACALLILIPWAFPALETVESEIGKWTTIVGSFTILWGAISSFQFHGLRAMRREEGWMWGAWQLIVAVVVMFLGLYQKDSAGYLWIQSYVISPITSTTFAILGFFIFAAVYHTVQIRSTELLVLTIPMIFTLITYGPVLKFYMPWAGVIGDWFGTVAAPANRRANTIGLGIAAIILGYRVLTGSETAWLGRRKE